MENKLGIVVRKPNFSFLKDYEIHYYQGNPFVTHLLNAFHIIFPAGEKFFIRAVNRYAEEIRDPSLKERVKAFAGQETQHMLQHQKFYDTLKRQGFPVEDIAQKYEEHAYGFVEPFVMKLFDQIFGEGNGRAIALSVTAALEHYTASLAEVALRHNEIFENLDEEIKNLLKWHAAEEIEHKSVTYDLFQQVDGRYFMRIGGFVIASLALSAYTGYSMVRFLLSDKELKFSNFVYDGPKALAHLSALAYEMGKLLLLYLNPNFHPDNIENRELAEKYFQEAAEYYFKKAS